MWLLHFSSTFLAILLVACTASIPKQSFSNNPVMQEGEVNFGPDIPLSSQDRALLRILSGQNISFIYDMDVNGNRSRVASRIRIAKTGDVYYFENYGGQLPGQGNDNGEAFRLNKTTNFLTEPARAAPAPSRLLDLSYYKGRATLQQGNLTFLTAYGGVSKQSGMAARIQTRFELGFSLDGKTCHVLSYYLQIDSANGNQSRGHNIGTSQCSVGGGVNP